LGTRPFSRVTGTSAARFGLVRVGRDGFGTVPDNLGRRATSVQHSTQDVR